MPGSSDAQAGGPHERFIGFLIEHYAGNFPLWFAPDQVRMDAEFSATPIKAKIADAEQQRVHTMLVIGGREMKDGRG